MKIQAQCATAENTWTVESALVKAWTAALRCSLIILARTATNRRLNASANISTITRQTATGLT